MTRLRHLLAALILTTFSASADIAYFESEPNDSSADYNPVAGAVTLYGSLQDDSYNFV